MKILMSLLVAVFFMGGLAVAEAAKDECPCYSEKQVIKMIKKADKYKCTYDGEHHSKVSSELEVLPSDKKQMFNAAIISDDDIRYCAWEYKDKSGENVYHEVVNLTDEEIDECHENLRDPSDDMVCDGEWRDSLTHLVVCPCYSYGDVLAAIGDEEYSYIADDGQVEVVQGTTSFSAIFNETDFDSTCKWFVDDNMIFYYTRIAPLGLQECFDVLNEFSK